MLTPIKWIFKTILEWNLIKKAQTILVYTSVIELGIFILQLYYMDHPLFDRLFLTTFLWFFPIMIMINFIFFILGLFQYHQTRRFYYQFAMLVVVYCSITLMVIPILVGLLNIANGVIFLGTILMCMILFPRNIVFYSALASSSIYIIATMLTAFGGLHYALAFQPHVLIHAEIEKMYIFSSMIYTIIYTAISIYLFDIAIQSWKEKHLFKDRLSRTDELTGLLNRRGINEMIHLHLQQVRITAKETSLIIADIDNFKMINDGHGHAQGDLVLKHVADLLRHQLRTSDILGRYGGEEFILLLPSTPLESARTVAEFCRQTLENQPIVLKTGELLTVHASFGVSSSLRSDFQFDTLFDRADRALYQAKKNGKNQVCVQQ